MKPIPIRHTPPRRINRPPPIVVNPPYPPMRISPPQPPRKPLIDIKLPYIHIRF